MYQHGASIRDRRPIAALYPPPILRDFLLFALLPCFDLTRALASAFWSRKRLVGIPLGNMGVVVVFLPWTGVSLSNLTTPG